MVYNGGINIRCCLLSVRIKYRDSYGVLYVEKNKTKGMDFSIIIDKAYLQIAME
jgi:hypothetical protein